MAYFSQQCTQVNKYMYVGGNKVAKNYNLLKQNGITHVVNCVGDLCENYHHTKLNYLTLFLMDSEIEDVMCILYDVIDFFDKARKENGKVYVHCQQGVSRSNAMCIAYLMIQRKLDNKACDYEACYNEVRAKRGVCRPNVGFMVQLIKWHKRLSGQCSELVLYRIASHNNRDRMRVLAKTVEDKAGITSAALDSRTVFVLDCKDTLYCWVGRGCQCVKIYIGCAVRLIQKLQAHEHGSKEVHLVYEGQEIKNEHDANFWSIMKNNSGVLKTNFNPSYDVDYIPYSEGEREELKKLTKTWDQDLILSFFHSKQDKERDAALEFLNSGFW